MADDRIATIIKEIKYWKEHRLLPDVQCDFLLALYTQGEEENHSSRQKRNMSYYFQLLLLVLMVPFSFLVVYFTQFNFILQLSILLLFIGLAIWLFTHHYKKKSKSAHIPLIVVLVLILMTTDFLANVLHLNELITLLFILLNFIGWYILSRRLHFTYLMFTSLLAIGIVLFVNISHLFSFN